MLIFIITILITITTLKVIGVPLGPRAKRDVHAERGVRRGTNGVSTHGVTVSF